ncbi:hypothetical protein GCM10009646_83890 [Streptomyces aureus]
MARLKRVVGRAAAAIGAEKVIREYLFMFGDIGRRRTVWWRLERSRDPRPDPGVWSEPLRSCSDPLSGTTAIVSDGREGAQGCDVLPHYGGMSEMT